MSVTEAETSTQKVLSKSVYSVPMPVIINPHLSNPVIIASNTFASTLIGRPSPTALMIPTVPLVGGDTQSVNFVKLNSGKV